MMNRNVKGAVIAVLAWLALGSSVTASPLEKPVGRVVLVIDGNVSETNHEGRAEFDLDMLEKIEGRSASMETPWTKGTTKFSGPMLRNVLQAVGADGDSLRFKALNGYEVTIPVSDAERLDTILATRMNDKPMSVRDKGPLFLVYPFDKDPSLYNERYFSRSIWQISEIEVVR